MKEEMIGSIFFGILGTGFIISALFFHNIFPNGVIDWLFVMLGIVCLLLAIGISMMNENVFKEL